MNGNITMKTEDFSYETCEEVPTNVLQYLKSQRFQIFAHMSISKIPLFKILSLS